MFIRLFLLSILISITLANLPICAWFRSAPFCGDETSCDTNYPILIDQCSTSKEAEYCPKTFGANCWTGFKILCCNEDVNPKETDSYTCGDDYKIKYD